MANVNPNMSESASQCNQIAAYLKSGHTLTQLDALRLFGCMRLASRICDLRERGLNIKTEKIQTHTGKYITAYSLDAKDAV